MMVMNMKKIMYGIPLLFVLMSSLAFATVTPATIQYSDEFSYYYWTANGLVQAYPSDRCYDIDLIKWWYDNNPTAPISDDNITVSCSSPDADIIHHNGLGGRPVFMSTNDDGQRLTDIWNSGASTKFGINGVTNPIGYEWLINSYTSGSADTYNRYWFWGITGEGLYYELSAIHSGSGGSPSKFDHPEIWLSNISRNPYFYNVTFLPTFAEGNLINLTDTLYVLYNFIDLGYYTTTSASDIPVGFHARYDTYYNKIEMIQSYSDYVPTSWTHDDPSYDSSMGNTLQYFSCPAQTGYTYGAGYGFNDPYGEYDRVCFYLPSLNGDFYGGMKIDENRNVWGDPYSVYHEFTGWIGFYNNYVVLNDPTIDPPFPAMYDDITVSWTSTEALTSELLYRHRTSTSDSWSVWNGVSSETNTSSHSLDIPYVDDTYYQYIIQGTKDGITFSNDNQGDNWTFEVYGHPRNLTIISATKPPTTEQYTEAQSTIEIKNTGNTSLYGFVQCNYEDPSLTHYYVGSESNCQSFAINQTRTFYPTLLVNYSGWWNVSSCSVYLGYDSDCIPFKLPMEQIVIANEFGGENIGEFYVWATGGTTTITTTTIPTGCGVWGDCIGSIIEAYQYRTCGDGNTTWIEEMPCTISITQDIPANETVEEALDRFKGEYLVPIGESVMPIIFIFLAVMVFAIIIVKIVRSGVNALH